MATRSRFIADRGSSPTREPNVFYATGWFSELTYYVVGRFEHGEYHDLHGNSGCFAHLAEHISEAAARRRARKAFKYSKKAFAKENKGRADEIGRKLG